MPTGSTKYPTRLPDYPGNDRLRQALTSFYSRNLNADFPTYEGDRNADINPILQMATAGVLKGSPTSEMRSETLAKLVNRFSQPGGATGWSPSGGIWNTKGRYEMNDSRKRPRIDVEKQPGSDQGGNLPPMAFS